MSTNIWYIVEPAVSGAVNGEDNTMYTNPEVGTTAGHLVLIALC